MQILRLYNLFVMVRHVVNKRVVDPCVVDKLQACKKNQQNK